VAAYVIVDVDVTDPEAYREYTAQTPGTVAQYGGRWLVRGGAYETIEGQWSPKRIVVIAFESVEQARRWYQSPEYQAILPLRLKHAKTNFLTIVEGV
jgi:uncharacterized protein (DUF1330 family)